MSFPVLFSSQLAAILDALLKAAVLEVTALVEDGAAELRLELRERDREIRDKDLEIEENHREIQELRATVELFRAREEAGASPVRSGGVEKQEQTESCLWAKEEDTLHSSVDSPDMRPTVKSEQTDEFTSTSSVTEQRLDLADNEMYSQSYQSFNAHLNAAEEDTDDSSHWLEQEASDSAPPQNIGEDLHLSDLHQAGFSQFAPIVHVQEHKRTRQFNTKRLTHIESSSKIGYRCDQCGKCFTEKRRLTTHQSVHTGAKPFSCRNCGKKFSRKDNCVRHERSDKHCGKDQIG